MRPGTRLGVDVGTVRVGVARSDPHGLIATPVETVQRDRTDAGTDIVRLVALCAETDAIEVIVGLPLALSGQHTASTADAVGFASRLQDAVDIPVRMVDERLTTVTAQSALRSSGRKSRSQRPVVDQVAAVIIVQHALDSERSSGLPPGTAVASIEGS